MSARAKNYLPILSNLYTVAPAGSEETGQRLAVYETIKAYARISPKETIAQMFDKTFTVRILISYNYL